MQSTATPDEPKKGRQKRGDLTQAERPPWGFPGFGSEAGKRGLEAIEKPRLQCHRAREVRHSERLTIDSGGLSEHSKAVAGWRRSRLSPSMMIWKSGSSLGWRGRRVAESPVHFECEYLNTVRFRGATVVSTVDVIFGRVVAVHIDDKALTPDGLIDVARLRPLARLGYQDYTDIDHTFTLAPIGSEQNVGKRIAALEGAGDKVAAELEKMGLR
jgi:hypothetical protein